MASGPCCSVSFVLRPSGPRISAVVVALPSLLLPALCPLPDFAVLQRPTSMDADLERRSPPLPWEAEVRGASFDPFSTAGRCIRSRTPSVARAPRRWDDAPPHEAPARRGLTEFHRRPVLFCCGAAVAYTGGDQRPVFSLATLHPCPVGP